MEPYKKLLLKNRAWSAEIKRNNPLFFQLTSRDQKPGFLWIGCADSRVPADDIIDTEPGELFVHRNIANLALPHDTNVMSVVQYAVQVLKVPDIIVCGHYGCGGVRAALKTAPAGPISDWLQNIKLVYRANQESIDLLESEDQRVNRLVELNVLEQVRKLSSTPILQEAWSSSVGPRIHGWVYSLYDGHVHELCIANRDEIALKGQDDSVTTTFG